MRRSTLLGLPLFLLTAGACSSATPAGEPTEEEVGRTSGAIINGSADTTHEAVVAIISQSGSEAGACTGTIVKVDATRKVGWVVTAAHCVDLPPVIVLQGDDYGKSDALRYEVVDYEADGRYGGQAGSSYDFAVVRIAGVDGSTPTIPLVTSPDGLTNGTPVTSVGYGRTTLIQSGPGDQNTVRRAVNMTLSQVGQTQIGYDMSARGICQGDSGGPVLVKSGGERVVGVHSYVQGDCNGFGVSGRVTAGLSFFNAQFAKAIPTEDCELCEKIANSGTQECATYLAKCFADPDCKGYYDCLSKGTSKATCASKFPKAEGPFNAAANCTCTRACSDKCASTLQCKTTPKCGFKLPAGDCTTCTEGACCAETLDCAADGTCYSCLKTQDADPECATNAARKKLATCVATSCKTECAGSGLDTGADPAATEGGGDGAPGSTTTKTTEDGCAVAAPGRTGGANGAGFALALAAAAALRRARVRRARPAA